MPYEKVLGQTDHFYLLWICSGDAKKLLAIPYKKFLHFQKIYRLGFVGAKCQAN